MEIYNLKHFTRGWLVGNFEPSIEKREDIEVGIQKYSKGEEHPGHYHKISDEFNVVISGKCKFRFYTKDEQPGDKWNITDNITLETNDIIKIDKNQATSFEAVEDCVILCIKTSSVINDKFLI